MFDRDDLRAAVASDVLSADQAARLESFLLSRHALGEERGQETLRFLSNFNDVFVTMGIVILFVGIGSLSMLVLGPSDASPKASNLLLAFVPVALAAVAMLEYFCARRRMLLPSMALAIIFVGACTIGISGLYAEALGRDIQTGTNVFRQAGLAGVLTFATALTASLLLFWRYRLPFSLFLAAFAAAGLVYAGFTMVGEHGAIFGGGVSLLLGLGTFAAALWFDMQDPQRIRKASDHAFWLHLAAAPQLILGVSAMITGSNIIFGSTLGADNASQGLVLLGMLLLLGIVALAINRRALIAASLFTFIWTLVFVLNKAGVEGVSVFMIVTLLIGSGVVFLGAGWKTARRAALFLFPRGGIWDRLFPPEPA